MIRTGIGLDAHRFVTGDGFRLGGVDIAHSSAVAGHSDGDVLIHAVVDALLGAAGLGDIGSHFPSSDGQWENADSGQFLERTGSLIREVRGTIQHIDATVVLQEPVIAHHLPAMRRHIAATLQLPESQVNLKATTTDYLGFTGRKEGLTAVAVATLEMP